MPRKSGDERREEIIEAVLALAAEQGVSRLTTQAIAERIGIAQPTIFRHFPTRERILRAVIDWLAARMLGIVTDVLAGRGPADERLRTLLDRQLGFIARHKGVPRLLFSERLHQDDPGLKAAVRQIMDAYTARIAELVREGRSQGRFRADLDAEAAAMLILATIQGLVMRWSITDFEFPLHEQGEKLWQVLRPALVPASDRR